jgi:hypothetical protein
MNKPDPQEKLSMRAVCIDLLYSWNMIVFY